MNWSEVVISVVSIIVTALASWGVTELTKLINSKIKDANAKEMLSSAVTTVSDVVKQVYQTYVEALKGQNAFTAEAQKEALAKALETIEAILPEKVKAYFQGGAGRLPGFSVYPNRQTGYGTLCVRDSIPV